MWIFVKVPKIYPVQIGCKSRSISSSDSSHLLSSISKLRSQSVRSPSCCNALHIVARVAQSPKLPHQLPLVSPWQCVRFPFTDYSSADVKVLTVGEELQRETLPLKMGKRLYQVCGLKQSASYEVKISYPASIPASFTIQLVEDVPELSLNKNRRLLNTEKLIFKADGRREDLGLIELYVLVTVEATGVVAIPGAREREFIIFNIVCDELALGIPYKAWWVGIAAFFCLLLASIIPYFLPSYLLPSNRVLASNNPPAKMS